MAFHGRGADEEAREQEVERVHTSPLTPSAETVHIARRAFSEDLHGTFFARWLQSRAAGLGGLPGLLPLRTLPRSEFTCKICLMQCDDRVKTTLSQCAAPQDHAVCRECLRCYLQGRIEERRVKDLRCPLFGSDCCQAVAQEHELSSILPEEVFQKYLRFLAMVEDATLRECPECGELVKPRMTGAGAEADLEANGAEEVLALNPEMLCSQGHVFCYYHSNAHPPGQGACEAYAREEAREAKLAMEAQGAKECPHCKAHTLKADGCNHMVCFACQSHWCWTCGKLLDGRLSLGWHYNPANPAGCLQFSALESKDMSSKLTLLARLFALPGTVLGFLVFWCTLPLWLLCGLGLIVTVVALVAVSCVWCPIAAPCVCGLSCCGLSDTQAELIMCAPCQSCWASVECLFGGLE